MNIKSAKINYLIVTILFMAVDSAHAMKRTLEDTVNQDVIGLPFDALNLVLANLTLEDLSVSFVNKAWLNSAEHVFSDFYELQRTYHKQTGTYKKENAFNILKELRKSYAQMRANGRSDKEIQALAQAFLKRNLESIHKTTQTPLLQRETEFAKYPERWMQLALLRIWDTILLTEPLESYETPCLKMLAPAEDLTKFFTSETDFDTKCEFATELCERGAKYVATAVREAWRLQLTSKNLKGIGKLYDIAISKDANALNAGDYIMAAATHYADGNWKRIAELYDIAISKDANALTEFDYHRAAENHYKIKNWKRAAELFEITISKKANKLSAFDYCSAADAHALSKNHNRSAELYDIAISKGVNKLNPYHYMQAIRAHYLSKNWKRTAQLFEIALTKGLVIPDNLKQAIYKNMAHAYEQLNDQQKAQEFRQKAADAEHKQ